MRVGEHDKPSKAVDLGAAKGGQEEETLFELEVYGENESATKSLLTKGDSTTAPYMSRFCQQPIHILEALRWVNYPLPYTMI